MKNHNNNIPHMALHGAALLERTLSLKIEEAYPKLKEIFLENGCKIIKEEQPNKIALQQGSLWGLTPKTAKKKIQVVLEAKEDSTQVECTSKLSADWTNITVVGCVFAAALVAVCVWMATDLGGVIVTGQMSFWSWLIMVGGDVNAYVGGVFVNLLWGLTAFLLVVIAVEGVILVYAHKKVEAFSNETLNRVG